MKPLTFAFLVLSCSCMVVAGTANAQSTDSISASSVNRGRMAVVSGVGAVVYGGGLYYLSQVWYKDHERTPFRLYDDSKGYLQMDKCGHAYTAYWESYAAYNALRWAGMKRKNALIIGGLTGFVFQAPIEVFDGLYEGWGFSWSDVGANAFGSALFATQQVLWNEQIIHMKFSYSPSPYREVLPQTLGETQLESFFLDYNAHTYWLSGSLKRMTGAEFMPSWLNLALGYSANGMFGEFSNPERAGGEPFPHYRRYRQWVLSLDVDCSKIPVKKPWAKTLLGVFNTIKVPFPALEYNVEDGLRGHWIYY